MLGTLTPHASRLSLSALAAATLLTACGGGGGDGAVQQASTPSTPPIPAVNNYELQTTVPSPTYAAGSWQEFAFAYLNDHRTRCGFGALKQDARLDQAAQAHSSYLARQSKEIGWTGSNGQQIDLHAQDPARPLFTGQTPTERARAAGYTGDVGEAISTTATRAVSPLNSATEKVMLRWNLQELLAVPYHMGILMSDAREVGFGFQPWTYSVDPPFSISQLVVNPGYAQWPQRSLTEVVSFPCEGSTDLQEAVYDEIPDPTVGQGEIKLAMGRAILVMGPRGSTLKVLTSSVTPVARLDGQSLGSTPSFTSGAGYPGGMFVLTADNDKNRLIRDPSKAFLHAHKPLAKCTKYRVDVSFTVNGGAPMSKTFQFSTRTVDTQSSIEPACAAL
jgi:hypothetical protein